MKTRTKETGRGTTEVTTIVWPCMALTLLAVVGLVIETTWAEMGTKFQEERGLADLQGPSEKTSYFNVGGAQFFEPFQSEKASMGDGFRFIQTDPHLYDGHRPYHAIHPTTNIVDGGALMHGWIFDTH